MSISQLQQMSDEQLLQAAVGEEQAERLRDIPLKDLFAEPIRFGSYQNLSRREALIKLQAAALLFQRSQEN